MSFLPKDYEIPEVGKTYDIEKGCIVNCPECSKFLTKFKLKEWDGTMWEIYECDICKQDSGFPISVWCKTKKTEKLEEPSEEDMEEEYGNPFEGIFDDNKDNVIPF